MVRRIGIYAFNEVEVLDLAGPYEVFTTASRLAARLSARAGLSAAAGGAFDVVTLGAEPGLVRARAGLQFKIDCLISEAPPLDLLVVPGGVIDAEFDRPRLIHWLASMPAPIVASVCTGAFLLARAGLLNGKRATTHWEDAEDLAQRFPLTVVEPDRRWIDEGEIVTSAGIAAGIDMSLHLVGRLHSPELATACARQMDYPWAAQPSQARLEV